MKKEFIFSDAGKGGKTKVILETDKLTISRPGIISKLSHGFSGDKVIFFSQITSIQLKKAGIGRGYIQFTIAGTPEKKSGMIFGDKVDENTIYFSSSFNNKIVNANANEIKKTIEKYLASSTKETIIKVDDKYDRLAKLKKLLDDNVINQEEFENEKNKLLNK